jgi:hypothetical protein
MSSNLDYTPIVTYTGAVDMSDVSNNYGSNIFNVFYDASLVSLGNLLMFEYKIDKDGIIQDTGTITTSDSNVGITNQWAVSVPALNNTYDPSMNISIRVYIGQYTTDVIGVTEWSIPLKLYNPPPQPEIESAYYDHVSSDASSTSLSDDDLYVFLKKGTYPNGVKFVVAYNYTNPSGTIKWGISPPLSVDTNNQIIVLNFGNVSQTKQIVYVSVYAVYTVDVDPSSTVTKNIYTMSRISKTFEAKPILDQAVSRPVITSIDYNVYTTLTREQIMKVNWNAPDISRMSTFSVRGYRVEMSDSSFNTIDASYNLDPDIYTANINVSHYGCGKTVNFRVIAKFDNGESMSALSSKKIFIYSGPPVHVNVLYASYIPAANSLEPANGMNISVNFKNPANTGCGIPKKFIITVFDLSNNQILLDNPGTVNYDSNKRDYTVIVKTVRFSREGYVYVNLQTEDTNDATRLLNGAISQDTYISSSTPIFVTSSIIKSLTPFAQLKFSVITYTALSPNGTVNLFNSPNSIPLSVDSNSSVRILTGNMYTGALEYAFVLPQSLFGLAFSAPGTGRQVSISLSNTSGTSSMTVPL